MFDIQKRTLEAAIRNLKALNAEFIIKDPEGTIHNHGTLVLGETEKPKKPRRLNPALPWGAITQYVKTSLTPMQVGDVIQVAKPDDVDLRSLHSTISSVAIELWGAGGATTHRDAKANHVEIMRLN